MSLLNISHDLTGYAEVCSLFLSPRYRTAGVGGLLSRSRFMFIVQFMARFPQRLCAEELRGHFDEAGESPFWNAVGSHFYQIDFNEADYLSSHGKESFVAELMPHYPVYLDLLPDAARDAVGVTHKDTAPARRMLEAEGLRYENHIDIFDAGLVLECHIADLRTVRESRLARVEIGVSAADETGAGAAKSLISNTRLHDFRCGAVAVQDGAFVLTPEQAAALCVSEGEGEDVRVLTSYPRAGWKRSGDDMSMYIDGEWQEGRGAAFESRNPGTDETVWQGRGASPEDVDRAVKAARRAFATWSAMPFR